MHIIRIEYSSRFERSLRSLGKEYREIVAEREKIFRANCFDPRLDTHKTKGKLRGFWSFSITHTHRILFEFLGNERVGFIDVGDHDIYR